MANQNRISYGFAPPATTERGYGPKKRLQFSTVATPEKPVVFHQILQLTVPAATFGTEYSNCFQRHNLGNVQGCKSSMEDFRLWQLFVRVASESKELFNTGASKKEIKEPKIIGFRGLQEDRDYFVKPEASFFQQFSRLSVADIETWAAEHDYRIVNEQMYVETWEAFAEEDTSGDGRVFCFIESIPKNYDIEELQHAAAYRLWILFESGCGLDLNAQVKDVITPSENRKKKEPIKHFDQYRFIKNNETFRQHVSNNLYRDDDAIKAVISMPLTEEANTICPTRCLNPKAVFNNTINHLYRDGTRKNIIPHLFAESQPDHRGFLVEDYIEGNKFIVKRHLRKHMIELTSRDLDSEQFMKKYKPDVWLHYILPRQLSAVMHKHAKVTEAKRDATYQIDEVAARLDAWNIDANKNYHFNGHGYKDIWAHSDNKCEGRAGKEWEEGNHDVMRVRTITYYEEVPRFNDEMKTAISPMHKHAVFLKYFKKSLRAFSRVMVPEAIVDNATFCLINYPNVLKEQHNYSTTIEPAWKFEAPTMQFFDLFISKMATSLEYTRFVATQHFKIIQMWLGSGCSKSLIQEKTHYTLQGPGQGGKSNALKNIKEMKTPGTVQELTHSSTLATLDMDCFNTIVQEHEQNPNAVGQGGNKRDNNQLKQAEVRKNMKTNGENTTTRLERKGKDSPMQTVVQNSIHSKVFMGCTNRKLSERDEASRSRDCELTLPLINRIGKNITNMRNAEMSQTPEEKLDGERFLYLCRMFDVWEHRIRAGQDQPLLIPEVSMLVWTDVLEHVRRKLKNVTETGYLVRAQGRMRNTLTTVIIMEAFSILFLFKPPKKKCVFYIDKERICDGALYNELVDKRVTKNGLHAEKEVQLFEDDQGNISSIEADSNGNDPKTFSVNYVKGVINPHHNTVDRSKEVASFRIQWEYEDEYYAGKRYQVGDVVKYRSNNVVYTLRCDREPSVEPELGDYWVVADNTLADAWDSKRNYVAGEFVVVQNTTFECKNDCKNVDPLRNTAWEYISAEMESLLGKYYEQSYDLQNQIMQHDISSLLYCTIPNAITTCGMNQDEILPQGLSKFIKQLCKFAKEKLMEVEESEAKRYNHCMPNNRDGVTGSKNQVEVDYIFLGDDYASGITKLLEKNFTPGYVVNVDDVFISDSLHEIKEQRTKKVQQLPDTVRIKKRFFRIQTTMTGTRETECTAQDAIADGNVRDGYLYKEEWQHWKTTVDADGTYTGGWKELLLDDIQVQHDKPEKRKIQTRRIGNQLRHYIYVPWIHEVTKSEDKDPFIDALSSYKFKSNDEHDRMEILLGTPYEGMVSTRNGGETKTCIPWVSNKVVLKPSLEEKVIYKHGQVIAEAAEMINIHESRCQVRDEIVLTDTFDQYANLHHQKTKMMDPQLQDVELTQDFADHFKYCCKHSLWKEAHEMQLESNGYPMDDFPRQLADKGYLDQMSYQSKKRKRNGEVPRNEPNVRPKVIPLNFNN